jgi:hypothetical protein
MLEIIQLYYRLTFSLYSFYKVLKNRIDISNNAIKQKVMPSGHKYELVIGSKSAANLTKEQKAFNKLIKRINTLRTQLSTESKVYEEQLEYHGKYLAQIELEISQCEMAIVKLLHPIYQNPKSLHKADKMVLKDIIKSLLYSMPFSSSNPPDADMEYIIKDIEGMSFGEAMSREFDTMKSDLEQNLRANGVEVDLSDLKEDMAPEEVIRRMMEIKEKAEQEYEQAKAKKAEAPKTKKQQAKIEKERQIEELRTKSLSTIYKQLVKVLHPDLEQDETQKPIKEELMKQLAVAYKNNDLPRLLMLEMEWINNESNNVMQQSDEQLKIYNHILKEQVEELELEMESLLHDPRFASLHGIWDQSYTPARANMKQAKKDMLEKLESLKDSIKGLQGPNPLKEVKDIINIFNRGNAMAFDFEELMELMVKQNKK